MQRQDNCILNLNPPTQAFPTTSCTIPIEWVALSLESVLNSNLRFQEAPGSVPGTSRSGGMMTMFSNGSVPVAPSIRSFKSTRVLALLGVAVCILVADQAVDQ